MKIGTDSVLLGCLADVNNVQRILDIGTGTGVLALMLAQRCEACIDAVEADGSAASEAALNISNSPWPARIAIFHETIQHFAAHTTQKYDLVISNPPYFNPGSNTLIGDGQRSMARHSAELPFEELIGCVQELLHPEGTFWLVLPIAEGKEFIRLCAGRLYPARQISIRPKKEKAVNRIVAGFCLVERPCAEEGLVVYDDDNRPSEAYKRLANAFYTGAQFSD